MCDCALRPTDGGCNLAHAGWPLMEQTEDGCPKSIPDGLHLDRGCERHGVIEVIARHRLARHRPCRSPIANRMTLDLVCRNEVADKFAVLAAVDHQDMGLEDVRLVAGQIEAEAGRVALVRIRR